MIEEARKLAAFGATDEEMAAFWGIGISTLDKRKRDKTEFLGALRTGKEMSDSAVKCSRFQHATSYSNLP